MAAIDNEHPLSADGGISAARKLTVDRLLREAIRRRWTGGEGGLVGIALVTGVLLLTSHPIWGVLLMLAAWGIYALANSMHRDEAVKEYPDLFDAIDAQKKT
jgi:hypothetical protein